ncbi:SURF1 family protein [Aestuariimicrobium kwangyangense]|uniref:SURF1 family protein n=1 Tax=Aestuariimicrobium kwangyangense TaxID=396389 RepID=UPI0006853346|nr:SURF1 family protein [Aestuariimicrobium kwangyangense]
MSAVVPSTGVSTLLKRTMIILVGLVVAGVMVVLGVWQMDTARLHGKQALEARAAQPAVPLESEATGTNVDALYGRQVTLTGSYVPSLQVYVGTKYPLRVLTAFKTSDGRIVAVARGSVASPSMVVPAPPTGTIKQTGLVLPSESAVRGSLPLQDARHSPIVAAVRVPDLVQTWPTPMVNGFVSLGEADARLNGLPTPAVTLPDGEESTRNAGYALQWWVFAGVAVIGSVVIARSVDRAPAKAGARRTGL